VVQVLVAPVHEGSLGVPSHTQPLNPMGVAARVNTAHQLTTVTISGLVTGHFGKPN
jgi:hypothetical protein